MNKEETKQPEALLQIFQALSDPIRLNILICLLSKGEKRIEPKEYAIVKSTLSHHIKILKQAQLITEIKNAPYKHYSINHTYLDDKFPGLLDLIKEHPSEKF